MPDQHVADRAPRPFNLLTIHNVIKLLTVKQWRYFYSVPLFVDIYLSMLRLCIFSHLNATPGNCLCHTLGRPLRKHRHASTLSFSKPAGNGLQLSFPMASSLWITQTRGSKFAIKMRSVKMVTLILQIFLEVSSWSFGIARPAFVQPFRLVLQWLQAGICEAWHNPEITSNSQITSEISLRKSSCPLIRFSCCTAHPAFYCPKRANGTHRSPQVSVWWDLWQNRRLRLKQIRYCIVEFRASRRQHCKGKD